VRLAVVVWPAPHVVAVLSDLERPRRDGVHWSEPEQWMVKVRPLGHVGQRASEALPEVLVAALAGAPTVDCTVGPVTRRLGGQWLGAPVSGLDDLAAAVFEATEDLVPVTHPQPFQANIVLARGRVPKDLAGDPISTEWTADTVHLVADRSSPGRHRFENLATVPLGR
jgi:hypothetical protein